MISCKSPSSLGDFIEIDANLKELKEFLKTFEKDKVIEL
jgi:hypothetical protein